jgi:plastocyanin
VRRSVIGACAFGLAVCALPAFAGAGASPGHRTVVLTIHHSRFSTAHVHVRPNSAVTFVVHNTDPIDHELIVGDDAVQLRHEAGSDTLHQGPGAVSVPAGSTRATTYTFPASGTLLYGCHLPGHWAYGMRGTIVISSNG